MKKRYLVFSIVLIILIYGCEQVIEEPEIIEEKVVVEEEREKIVTVRLCHDTDNGIVRWVNGSTFGFYDNAERFEFDDYCFDNNFLIEYYCQNEIPQNRSFLCDNGCLDNHCL